MLRNSELSESSGSVSINACFTHLVFPVDSSWMGNTGLNDSVQQMVVMNYICFENGCLFGRDMSIKHTVAQPALSF